MRIPLSLIALAAFATTPAALADDTPLLPANQSWRIQLGEGMCELRLDGVQDLTEAEWMGSGTYDCGGAGEMISWHIELINGQPELSLSGEDDVFDASGCREGWPDWAVGQRGAHVCWLRPGFGQGVNLVIERLQ